MTKTADLVGIKVRRATRQQLKELAAREASTMFDLVAILVDERAKAKAIAPKRAGR